MTIIKIQEIEGSYLYAKYPGQSEPQDCYVELNCRSGALSADYNPEIGNAVPARVYHGHERRYPIPALTAEACNTLLAEIAPLAQRVVDGYESRWDGHDHVASLDDDATKAEAAIEQLCEAAGGEGGELIVWDATEWFAPLGQDTTIAAQLGVTADSTDADLDAIEERELATARNEQGVHDLDNIGRYLRRLRQACLDNGGES